MLESPQPLFTRHATLAALAFAVACSVFLWMEHRPVWSARGPALWSAAWTTTTSQNVFDPYVLSHVLHGVILFWLLRPLAGRVPLAWRFTAAVTLEIGWELLENSPWVIDRYRQDTAAFDYTGDTIINSLGDIAAAALGFVIAARFNWKVSVAVFVALELWMLAVARDNLTLNVLMLIHPIDAIKQWQLTGIGLPG